MTAIKLVDGIITSLPTHGRAVMDEEVTYSDLSERVRHSKILIKIMPGCDERCVASEEQNSGYASYLPEILKVKVEMNPLKKPYVTEMGKLLRWPKKMSVPAQLQKSKGLVRFSRHSEPLQDGRLTKRSCKD